VSAIVILLCLAITAAGAPRWLRVAQREHYLPGQVAWTEQLWLSRSLVSALLWLPIAGLFALGYLVSAWWYVPAAIVAQLIPVGLPFRGRTSRLVWTSRVRRVAFVLGLLVLAIGVWSPGFAAATSLFLTLLVDLALLLLRPLEKRLSRGFLDQARDRVAKVSPTLIAITGSYGKTTAKNYLAHLLSSSHTVLASPASFNNEMGLSRAVNDGLVPGTEVFIAEMGTYGRGEIARLCEVFPPDIAVITAIGEVHLQRMQTREGVLAAKSEITVRASKVVLNTDDDLLVVLADSLAQQGKTVIRCSVRSAEGADVSIVGGRLVVRGEDIGHIELPDSVHPANAACALGAAIALGDEARDVAPRLATLPTVAHRLEPVSTPDGSWVLDDTYNSNPAGAAEAVRRAVRLSERSGGKVHVVTPGMVELGPLQEQRNEELGAAVAAAGAATLVVVGKTNGAALTRGGSGGVTEVLQVATREDGVKLVEQRQAPGDVVLFENDLPDHYP
jgi:UDP-N-acetylmuramoyl-tripeptide--D-alanyl-D-alanine ligase